MRYQNPQFLDYPLLHVYIAMSILYIHTKTKYAVSRIDPFRSKVIRSRTFAPPFTPTPI